MTDTDIPAPELPDFDKLWDYSRPDETERRFRELLPEAEKAGNLAYRLELQTQIARTYGLRGMFAKAHEVLDDVEQRLTEQTRPARIRYLLERGRAFNSSGEKDKAVPLFHEAWTLARDAGEDFHAIDAAHMLGIALPLEEQLAWSEKALAVAEQSKDLRARRWAGVLYHNIGMTHLDAGRIEEALRCFETDLEFRKEHGGPQSVRISKWCVGHALRKLERYDEALRLQRELEAEYASSKVPSDGFVEEEIGELLLAQGRPDEARPYFQKAWPLLREMDWIRQSDPARLDRLQDLAEGE